MTSRQATVKNEYGIHCRPVAVIVAKVRNYAGTIQVVTADGYVADCKSIIDLIQLGIKCADTVVVHVDGPDEEATCARVAGLFETRYDFPR
jgi:phosphotransferase system HPr (HPr) family protein